MTLYQKTCNPDAPHRNPANGSDCDNTCYTPATPVTETQWCRRHKRYASFTGSRGLTCGWPGQEECWCVAASVYIEETP